MFNNFARRFGAVVLRRLLCLLVVASALTGVAMPSGAQAANCAAFGAQSFTVSSYYLGDRQIDAVPGDILTLSGDSGGNYIIEIHRPGGALGRTANVPNGARTVTYTAVESGSHSYHVFNQGAPTVSATAACTRAPTVSGVAPASGPIGGANTVVLTGAFFTGATAVSFGAAPASSFTVNSATQITATAPSGSAGTVNVTVTTPAGASATSSANQYAYVDTPTVTGLSPTSGPANGTNSVVLTGTNFTGATGVSFGAVGATSFTVNSATQITATAPSGSGNVNVTVTNAAGTSATASGNTYAYLAAPTVTFIQTAFDAANPFSASGLTTGDETLVITGTNLAAATSVTIGGASATITGASATELRVKTPVGTEGEAAVVVTTPGGQVTAGSTFGYIARPTLTGVAIQSGSKAGGNLVLRLTGTGFVAGQMSVQFGGVSAGVSVVSSTLLDITPPSGWTSGSTITVIKRGIPATNTPTFTYALQPKISSVSPSTGAAGGGTQVTVTGTELTDVTSVTVGGSAVSNLVATSTSLTFQTPAGSGAADVVVTSAGGSDTRSGGFTYIAAPTISSLLSTRGPTIGGQSVGVLGSNFSGATGVTIGGVAATGFSVSNDGLLFFTTPVGTAGVRDIVVTTAGGSATASGAYTYVFIQPVTVTGSLSAGTIALNGSSTVTLTLTNPNSEVATGVWTVMPLSGLTASAVGGTCGGAQVNANGLDVTTNMAANSSCTVTASLSSATPGTYSLTPGGHVQPYYYYEDVIIRGSAGSPATLTVASAPGLNPAAGALPGGQVGQAYSQVFSANGGAGASTFSHTAGALPPPLSLASDGTLSGTPTTAGNFTFSVTATDTASQTATESYTLNIAKGDQTITFNNPGSQNYGTTPTLTATTSASLTVAFTSATPGVCTISSAGTLTFLAAGTCTINADQAGNAAWNAATRVSQSFTVNAVAPTAANVPGGSAPYNAPYAIDLSSSITGQASSVAVASGPSNGTTSVSGLTITYTPNTGYYGSDTFTYTATGPGGTSSPATVSLTVATPAAPVASANSGVAVSYNSTGAAIDLSGSITGVHSSIAVATMPSHGTFSVAGNVVTYVPTTAYFGADSFSYTATGPGGTSAPATISLTVATPAAPAASARPGVAVPYNSTGAAIDLSGSISGVHSSIAVSSMPSHGSVSVAGNVVTYTPTTAYFGADSFVYTATGPGGTSAPATVSLTVATPAAPIANEKNGVTAPFNSTGLAIDLSGSIIGVRSSIAVTTGPSYGTVSVAGDVVTYTPNTGFHGGEFFSYTATGPGGTSAPANVYILVTPPPAPVASNINLGIGYNSGGTAIDLSPAITGVADLVTVSGYPQHGSVNGGGASMGYTYTPVAGYFGPDSFSYVAHGPGGQSSPATVTLTVATPAPVITSISPAGGPVAGGTIVTLTGENFVNVTGVKFGALNAASATVNSPTRMTVVSPAGSAGPVNVTITNDGGTSATSTSTTFTYGQPISLTPAAGALPGATTGAAYSQTFTVSGGVGSKTFAVTAGALPAGMTLSTAGVLSGSPTTPGTFTFTVTATDSVGIKGATTYSLPVVSGVPTVANRPGVAVPYDSTGVAIDLSASITGNHDSVSVATAPAHGTTSVSGDVVTYRPTAGYYGADSFTYTATNGGATSTPATVSLTVATPAAPVAADKPSVAVAYGSSGTAIDLAASITGVHSSIAVGTAPAHGTVNVSGDVVTYTPTAGYYGADSFTYNATGPGGASAVAAVSLTVATPAAPVASAKSGVAVPYNSTGVAIDLAALISGVHSSAAVATAPAHGTVTFAGDVATYVPTSGYYGSDSFTFTATGPGGTSAPATVSLTVATPAAPVSANKSGVAVAYGSTGTAIDLAASITGVHSSLAIAAQPAHGTVTVAGEVVTYVPTAAYYGGDSFTFTVTGPGGTSSPATVSLVVANPAAPVATGLSVNVAHGMARTIDLAPQLSGVRTSVAIAMAPAHGSAVLNGDVVTYTPAAGYAGADSFTFTVTGPGGTSAPATVSLSVGAAPEATAQAVTVKVDPASTGSNTAGPVEINLASAVRNAVSIEILTEPRNGFLTINGLSVTYTPNPGFYGTDSFTYRAIGAGVDGGPPSFPTGFSNQAAPSGPVSAAATVTIVIAAPPITAPSLNASTMQGKSVEVNLTATAQGGPFTGATIVTGPASASGAATIVKDGGAYVMRFTPAGAFSGTAMATYTLTNASGTSLPGTVTFTVTERPNPLADSTVISLASAAVEDARRFGSTQVELFGRRLEQLHGEQQQSGTTIALAMAGATQVPLGSLNPSAGRWSAWADGVVSIGRLSPNAVEFDLTTDGLAGGIDRRFSDRFSFGVGAGYGHGKSESGSSLLETDNALVAAYGSWRPTKDMFVDALLGGGKLTHDMERTTTANTVVTGTRDGSVTLGSVTTGFDRQLDELRLTYYGRASVIDGSLDPYTEVGDPTWALSYGKQSLSSFNVAVGTKIERTFEMDGGRFTPRLRFEFQRELKDAGVVTASYADWVSSPIFSETLIGAGRSQLLMGAGADYSKGEGRFTFDYSVRTSTDRDIEHRLSLGGGLKF